MKVLRDLFRIESHRTLAPSTVAFFPAGWYSITSEYGPTYFQIGKVASISATVNRGVVPRDQMLRLEVDDRGITVSTPAGVYCTVCQLQVG